MLRGGDPQLSNFLSFSPAQSSVLRSCVCPPFTCLLSLTRSLGGIGRHAQSKRGRVCSISTECNRLMTIGWRILELILQAGILIDAETGQVQSQFVESRCGAVG